MQLRPFLKGIADAIRGKEGSTATIHAADFASRIASLPSGEDELDALVEGTLTEFVNDRVTEIRTYLFGTTDLQNVTLRKVECQNVTRIGTAAFQECTALTSVSFPRVRTINGYAFAACSNLQELSFPALEHIASNAFSVCLDLEYFEMGDAQNESLGSWVGDNSFYAAGLRSFVIRWKDVVSTLADVSAFTSTPIDSGTGYIYVPRSLVDAYKTAGNWSTYANQIRALEDYTVDGTTTGELDETKI